MKNIQMSMSFLNDVYVLVNCLNSDDIDPALTETLNRVRKAIEAKFEAMERREAFTQYKTGAPGSDGREQGRQKYLEMAKIPKDFQSLKEVGGL